MSRGLGAGNTMRSNKREKMKFARPPARVKRECHPPPGSLDLPVPARIRCHHACMAEASAQMIKTPATHDSATNRRLFLWCSLAHRGLISASWALLITTSALLLLLLLWTWIVLGQAHWHCRGQGRLLHGGAHIPLCWLNLLTLCKQPRSKAGSWQWQRHAPHNSVR